MSQDFYQDGPDFPNQYLSDRLLRSILKRKLGDGKFREVEADLTRFGERLRTEVESLGIEAETHPPVHVPFDPWGRRIDQIDVSPAWRRLDQISAEEGIVAIGYERKSGALSRVEQFAKLYLFSPSSAIYSCPLAMTDGAARAIELYGDAEMKQNAYRHLTSRDPAQFWTSGQWMTERTGGSDVSGTSTVARREDGTYRLYGTKWFTSATTSQMAMTLARIEGAPAGSAGLSLFYLELRDSSGALNRIRVHRLKEKLGTRALPTAELSLEGTPARLVGGEGNGVKKISSLFNITRIYNACCSVANSRRASMLARGYARKRKAFGKLLIDLPLHVATLAAMEVETQAGLVLVFDLAELLGREETGQATEADSALLRLLTPLAKLYTAKQGVSIASEALECFGGAGYVEDTGFPKLLRDGQVMAIWEGTTNVLSLDALRAIQKSSALEPYFVSVKKKVKSFQASELKPVAERIESALQKLEAILPQFMAEGEEGIQAGARQLAFSLARVYSAALLGEHADWSLKNEGSRSTLIAALRFSEQDLAPVFRPDQSYRSDSRHLADLT